MWISVIIRLLLLSPEQLEHTELLTGPNITLMLLIFFTVKAFWVHFQIWHSCVEFACLLQLLLFPPTFPKNTHFRYCRHECIREQCVCVCMMDR